MSKQKWSFTSFFQKITGKKEKIKEPKIIERKPTPDPRIDFIEVKEIKLEPKPEEPEVAEENTENNEPAENTAVAENETLEETVENEPEQAET